MHAHPVMALVVSTCVYLVKLLGPELQGLLRFKEDLSKVLIFQDAKKPRLKLIKIKIVLIFLKITMISLTTNTTSIQAIYFAFNVAC